MKIHTLTQGSPEWLAYRAQHFNASDAPAMLGISPYKTRNQLLAELHTGMSAEVDPATQRRFDDGHRFEALARTLAEEIIGDDLYAVVGSEGVLSASYDGLTLSRVIGFEHKTMNAELYGDGGPWGDDFEIPLHYRAQMEQQLLVSGAERILFMASRWDANDTLDVEQHCWYTSDAPLRAKIVSGWEQFGKDLAAYAPVEIVEKPKGTAIMALPALNVLVTGDVVSSNLPAFRAAADEFISSISEKLETDQDFANAKETVKFCDKAEKELERTKAAVLAQTASIDEVIRTVDYIQAQMRDKRLALDKMVTKRETEIKTEKITAAKTAYADHVAALEKTTFPAKLRTVAPDFVGAAKNKRTLASLQEALDTALANGKIATNTEAADLVSKLEAFKVEAAGYEFLFADLAEIVHKAADDFKLLVQTRVAGRQADEAAEKLKELSANVQSTAVAEAQAASAPTLVSVVAASTPTLKVMVLSQMRQDLNAHLDTLADDELERVLRFCQSRYPLEAKAA